MDSQNNAAVISPEQEKKIFKRFIEELDSHTCSLQVMCRFLSLPEFNLAVSGEDSAEFILMFLSYLKNMRRLIDANHLIQNISYSEKPELNEPTWRPKSGLHGDLCVAKPPRSKNSLNSGCTIMRQLMAAYTTTDLYLDPRREEIAGDHSNLKNGNS